MSIEVKVPQLPESVEDATVVTWHKQAGDRVERDENLLDLETDKVVLEVPAPQAGVLGELKVAEGDVVTPGTVVAVLEPGEGGGAESAGEAKPGADEASAGKAAQDAPAQDASQAGQESDSESPAMAAAEPAAEAASALSPAVRRLVEEHQLDPAAIKGTGRGGRLTKADVLNTLERGPQTQDRPAPAGEAPAASAEPAAPAAAEPASGERPEQRVPMTRLRARIAERLVQAQQSAAMLTTFNEVDLTEVNQLRRRHRDAFEQAHEARLGMMSFFVKAAVEALKRYPIINASIDGKDIVYHGYFDIGIAVASPRGLVVPILRDADGMSFADVEKGISAYVDKAKSGSLSMDDLTGGTFSITNGGVFGSMLSTPILNPPQSAILGMHKIEDRPRVMDGEIRIRSMMYLALSYDHRLVDGKDAVQFLVAIKEFLEDPARLLLQV